MATCKIYVQYINYSGEVTAISTVPFTGCTELEVPEVFSREGILMGASYYLQSRKWKVVGNTLKELTEDDKKNSLIFQMRKAKTTDEAQQLKTLHNQKIEEFNKRRALRTRAIAPYKSGICILTKNEHEYLLEFLKHHIALGFDHIWVYDNESDIPVSEAIKVLPADVLNKITVEVVANHDGKSFQSYGYQKWLDEHRTECEWVAVIDTDEFIELRDAKNINEFLNRFIDDDITSIALHWENYNANGHEKKTAGTLAERFTQIKPLPVYRRTVKSITRTASIKKIDTHWCERIWGRYVDALGKDWTQFDEREPKSGPDAVAVVRHYFTKSYEEWCNKMNRGNVSNFFHRRYEEFFWHNPDLEYLKEDDKLGWKMEGKIDKL